ncbi:DUF4144 family protein [Oceanisphaera arctica]|uniref:Uncharacterized protein n=1 Tax=Oceanisphaera arctica TaxID=641510 RepID=A0A2P5THZ8_9GAMM|nr:DUF4144 family protein [Oceanisphaera arctica]PPL14187.1 hypothetical protein UN63_16385 [Oceanisphaera arctica]GHA19210.1 hypothetical protein GCM10007082_19720 [Oceanisphaera arctica]
MIHWPAIIEFAGGHGYAWVADLDEVTEHRPGVGDRLLDSQGYPHLLSQQTGGGLYWQHQLRLVSLFELNAGLRVYAASLGICCTSKLVVRTPAEAIALVAWLEQQ